MSPDPDCPPPGDIRRQIPAEILAYIQVPVYLSTACEVADLLDKAVPASPGTAGWAAHMHDMCRLTNKYTGSPCVCPHHERGE